MSNEELLSGIYEKVSRIDTKVAVIEEQVKSNGELLGDHEKRLRTVEKKIWLVTGVGIALSWFVQKLVKWGGG